MHVKGIFKTEHGDCLELMKGLPDKSIDLILCDLPYGTTACKWDVVIPFEPLWEQYKRVIKRNGAIVLTASQPFTSALVMSNPALFKYCWVWDKGHPTGFLNAKKRPLIYHEDVCVFYEAQPTYNPQKWKGQPNHSNGTAGKRKTVHGGVYGNAAVMPSDESGMKYPKSIVPVTRHPATLKLHPTQKPVALMEYLIQTYTGPGEVVMDNCMGSGSTGVACLLSGRKFIGYEKEEKYFNIANERLCKTLEDMK